MRTGTKVIVHTEEVGDRIVGIMGGYIRWSGLVDEGPHAISVIERLAGRQLDPFARNVILIAPCARGNPHCSRDPPLTPTVRSNRSL